MNNVIYVGIGEYHILLTQGILSSLGLGSCVGVALYDKFTKIGGLAHVMLPDSKQVLDNSNRGKFADTAIIDMLEEMLKHGARREGIIAKLAGGAHMFAVESDILKIGERNIKASREILSHLNIPIFGEEVGGSVGRTIEFYTESGLMKIKTANKLIKEI